MTTHCTLANAGLRARRPWWWVAVSAVWLCVLFLLWGILLRHAFQPSKVPAWPVMTTSLPASKTFRIVLFAHPCCPCTRATLEELNESLTRLPKDTSVSIVFVTAGLAESDVAGSPNVALARQLSGVQVRFDCTGEEARRLNATVSGEVFAFDRAGRLVFQGGLTPGRGHQGESAGQKRLEQLASGLAHEPCTAPVFGCHLPTD